MTQKLIKSCLHVEGHEKVTEAVFRRGELCDMRYAEEEEGEENEKRRRDAMTSEVLAR